jgi:hypothetical protein
LRIDYTDYPSYRLLERFKGPSEIVKVVRILTNDKAEERKPDARLELLLNLKLNS